MKVFGFAALLFLSVSSVAAQEASDAYYAVALEDLHVTGGEIPKGNYVWNWREGWEKRQYLRPEVEFEVKAEGYITFQDAGYFSQGNFSEIFPGAKLFVRAPSGQTLSGHLFVPKTEGGEFADLAFSIDLKEAKAEHRSEFFDAKKKHYERLAGLEIPGTAWFRHQAALASKELGQTPPAPTFQGDVRLRNGREPRAELENCFDLFSGGRAISENLQLDRAMPSGADAEETVALSELEGIKIRALDWKSKLAGKTPALDALAGCIPADQFALFFPSFEAMTNFFDEADRVGTPILQSMESRSEDALTRSRYEKQLCLEMSTLARMYGPQFVDEVAVTASDPYFREGADVAILFRPKPGQGKILADFVRAKQKASGGASSPDRSISSVLREMKDAVVVSNSELQARKIEEASKNTTLALASQDDYKFFRSRYEKGAPEETALLVLPDAAIRNWCSPRWRIGEARRLRAAAFLAELQAERQDSIVAGKIPAKEKITTTFRAPGGGEFFAGPGGVEHSIYGSLAFLTPIAELPLEKVTKQEADLYKRWKQGYESNWSAYFDPIAVRFSVKPEKLGLDVSVYPLILGSDYREMAQVVRHGVEKLPANAADPHGALVHFAMSLDPESEPFREASKFLIGMAPQLKPNPFQWIGGTAALFLDDDPVWAELAKEHDGIGPYFDRHPIRLPLGLWIEVKNPLALAAFLTGLRSMANMAAPGLTKWDTIEENGQSYVKITATVGGPHNSDDDDAEDDRSHKSTGELQPGQMAIYYVATPNAFLLTLDEGVLKRYLARHDAKGEAAKTNSGMQRPWLAGSYCLQADVKLLEVFDGLLRENMLPHTQVKSWSNLPVLNEWKRLYPDREPLEVHRALWGTQLVCPAGGEYVWNAKTRSMESTLCGSPRAPKAEAKLPAVVKELRYGNFGVTFEENGIRARVELERAAR